MSLEKLSTCFEKYFTEIVALLVVTWLALHVAGVVYGSQNVPMHVSYVGDEQSPVNGALHMLKEHNPFALRNHTVLYYGPLFATFAVPAVVADAGYSVLFEEVRSAQEYKEKLLFDWGGIVLGIHTTAVLVSLVTLVFFYKLLMLESINASKNRKVALLGVSLLALNYYFFEYSHFYKHWIFIQMSVVGQLYFALRIREVKGVRKSDWLWHGVLASVIFGVSYFGLAYSVAFLPLAYTIWRGGGVSRRNLYTYVLLLVVACFVIYLWHPYALQRYLGFTGVGDMAGKVNNSQNPFLLSTVSLSYYFKLVVVNHLTLFGAGIVLTYAGVRKIQKSTWFLLYMLFSIVLVTAVLFVPVPHHEGRYMLPVILALIVGVSVALVQYVNGREMQTRVVTISLVTLLGCYLLSHGVFVGKWIDLYAKGPAEREMISKILELQTEDEPVLFVHNYLVGYPHTYESYEAYMKKTGKTEVNLYREILETPLPAHLKPLNVRYVQAGEFADNPQLLFEYEHVAYQYIERPWELNQFDYIDENPLRLWYADVLLPSYMLIK